MKRKAKAKMKDYLILTVLLIAMVTFFISTCAIAEEMFNWIIPLLASLGVMMWFAEANK